MTRVLVVSGTGTGIGKTVVTAATAALAIARGDRALTLEALAARKLAHAGVVIERALISDCVQSLCANHCVIRYQG